MLPARAQAERTRDGAVQEDSEALKQVLQPGVGASNLMFRCRSELRLETDRVHASLLVPEPCLVGPALINQLSLA
jgi:hypothetical protein